MSLEVFHCGWQQRGLFPVLSEASFSLDLSSGEERSLLSLMFSSKSLFYTFISLNHLEFIFDERI